MNTAILINTPQKDFQKGIFTLGNSRKNQPLDLAILAAILEKQGWQAKIIDGNLLQVSNEQIVNEIRTVAPKLIILNTASLDRWECPLPTIEAPRLLAAALKKAFPKAVIIAIGPHGTVTPDWVLEKCRGIDILVRGEPELTVQEIAANFPLGPRKKNKILGLSFIEGGKIINNPSRPYLENLDQLPLPAYHLLPMKLYGPLGDHFNGPSFSGETSPFAIMLTSRGCPGQCTFCFKKMYQDKKTFRSRSPQNVVAEIELLVKKYHVRAIYFQDLSFCIDQKRVIAICQEINRRGLKFSWGAEARFDTVRPATLAAMKKAGCAFINFGLESGSEKIIFLCQKNIPIKVAEKTIADCRQVGISVGCFKILSLPGETRETFIETLGFMVRNKVIIPYPFPIVLPLPYPGTVLHQQAEEQFKTTITWENAPDFAGRVGTDFLDKVGYWEVQKLAYEFKLKQEGRRPTRHYLRLSLLEKREKLKKLFSSKSSRSFSSQ